MSEPKATIAAPAPLVKGDEPLACVDAQDSDPRFRVPQTVGKWEHDVARRLERALPELRTCAESLAHSGKLEVGLAFHADGTVGKVFLTRSTVDDCEAVECVAQKLQSVTAPSPLAKKLSVFSATLALAPREAPRRLEEPSWDATADNRRCLHADEQPGANGHIFGRLPPEQIQKVVRDSYPSFRHCYEAGLGRNQRLTGKVTVRFTIDRSGQVAAPLVVENTIPDCQVTTCVRDEFKRLHFPEPDGGIVTVVYPIMLEPG